MQIARQIILSLLICEQVLKGKWLGTDFSSFGAAAYIGENSLGTKWENTAFFAGPLCDKFNPSAAVGEDEKVKSPQNDWWLCACHAAARVNIMVALLWRLHFAGGLETFDLCLCLPVGRVAWMWAARKEVCADVQDVSWILSYCATGERTTAGERAESLFIIMD